MSEISAKKFLKSLFSISTGTVATIGFHFLSILVLTRGLSKEEFGQYVLLLVIVNALKVLGGLGLDLTVVKFHSSGKNDEDFGTILALRVSFLFFLALIVVGLGRHLLAVINPSLTEFAFLLAFLFFVHSLRELLFHLLQALRLFKQYAWVQVGSAALKFLCFAAWFTFGYLTIPLLLLLELIIFAFSIAAQLVVVYFRTNLNWKFNQEKVGTILRFSIPLYMNNIVSFLYDRVNVLIMGMYLFPASIAAYEISYKIPEAFQRLFKSFIVVYFPNSASLFNQQRSRRAVEMLNIAFSAISYGILLIAFFFFLLRKEIIVTLFSARYQEAALGFFLLMMNFYFRALANLMGYTIVSAGYSAVPVKVNSIASLVNIGGCLILIPEWGAFGAIVAMIIMNVLTMSIYYGYLWKKRLAPSANHAFHQFIIFLLCLLPAIYFDHANVWIKASLGLLFPTLSYLVLAQSRQMVHKGISIIFQKQADIEVI